VIALWGPSRDQPLAAVRTELEHAGAAAVVIDQGAILATEVRLSTGRDVRGFVRAPGLELDLARVSALYVRTYDSHRLPSVASAGPDSPAWQHASAVDDALSTFAQLTPALVLNRPFDDASNASKPYQLRPIRDAGFSVPDTVVTTDPATALEFWERHRDVVYKSASAMRSRVTRLAEEHRERLTDVAWCPTQFQRWIDGVDHRVHVVGEELFACAVRSQLDDYRFAESGDALEMEPVTLPADVAERCLKLSRTLHLPLAGIDLRQTVDGEWYCFEVNPAPHFSYYEEITAQPIAAAVARLLRSVDRASTRTRRRAVAA